MAYYKKLVGEKCYLSPLAEEDADNWVRWLNIPEGVLVLGDESHRLISKAKAAEMVNRSMADMDAVFTIVDNHSNEAIGRIRLFDVHQVYQIGMLDMLLGERESWTNGYGFEAIQLMLDYGFNFLNLHHITLEVVEYDKKAYDCYQQAGFKEIGRRREARPVGDRYYDVVFMDTLASEYHSVYVKKMMGNMGA